MIRTALVVAIVLISSACVGRPADDATGEEIYLQLCSNCHGDDLGGSTVGPAIGPGSNAVNQPDAFLEMTILDGRGSMPSFQTSLDSDQVDLLVAYIRMEQGVENGS